MLSYLRQQQEQKQQKQSGECGRKKGNPIPFRELQNYQSLRIFLFSLLRHSFGMIKGKPALPWLQ